jgi:hypothetical protein
MLKLLLNLHEPFPLKLSHKGDFNSGVAIPIHARQFASNERTKGNLK